MANDFKQFGETATGEKITEQHPLVMEFKNLFPNTNPDVAIGAVASGRFTGRQNLSDPLKASVEARQTGSITPPTQTGGVQGSQTAFMSAYSQLIGQAKQMQDIQTRKNKLLLQLYDRDLTPEELRDLSPQQQAAIREGNRSVLEMEVMHMNDLIKGRTDESVTSLQYLLKGYEMDVQQAEQLRREAEQRKQYSQQLMLSLVDRYGALSGLSETDKASIQSGNLTPDIIQRLGKTIQQSKELRPEIRQSGSDLYQLTFDPITQRYVPQLLVKGATGGGGGNKITLNDAKSLGIPAGFVGMTEQGFSQRIQSAEPDPIFIQQLQGQNPNIEPIEIQRQWNNLQYRMIEMGNALSNIEQANEMIELNKTNIQDKTPEIQQKIISGMQFQLTNTYGFNSGEANDLIESNGIIKDDFGGYTVLSEGEQIEQNQKSSGGFLSKFFQGFK